MLLLILSIILILILFYIYTDAKSERIKKLLKFSIFMILFSVFLEFTLFNFRFYESLFYKEIKISDYTLGNDLKLNRDGTISVIGDVDNYIEIRNLNKHINNIYLDFDIDPDDTNVISLWIGYTDAANRYYAYTPVERIRAKDDTPGEILKAHFVGKTNRIKFYLKTTDDKKINFKVNEIAFNKKVDLNISLVRPFLIISLALLIYAFRPKSSLYQMKLFDSKAKKAITITIVLQLVLMVGVSQFNQYLVQEDFETLQRHQYQLLAEAFMKGQTYLDVEPHQILKDLKNPYDKKARINAFKKLYENIDNSKKAENFYIWDAAFYNNHYYVYFGVAPVILYYLPFYAITGQHITTAFCITVTAIITVIGIFLLLYEICKKWFKKVNLGAFLAIFLLFANASGILFILGRPDHYSLPILMGIMFSIYGLYWWLKASYSDLKGKYLFLGSLCMASVAACRPQLLLTSFFAIPIFFDDVFKTRKIFSKDSIKKTVLFVAPYVVIAALLMVYNYVRFGSPFDFGANYNLTTNDMTRRGFIIDRIPLGIFYYLFNPVNLSLRFPFVMRTIVDTSYMGTTIYEDMGAGFIFANILTVFGLFIFKYRKEFKVKLLYKIGALAVIFTFIIIIADTEMAGILPRYICDFGFLLYLATSIVLFNKLSNNKNNEALNKLIFVALIIGAFYNFFLLFSDSIVANSGMFFYLRRLLQFWI